MDKFDEVTLENMIKEDINLKKLKYKYIQKYNKKFIFLEYVIFKMKQISNKENSKYIENDTYLDNHIINTLINECLFTLKYECLDLIKMGLHHSAKARMRMIHEKIREILILKYCKNNKIKNILEVNLYEESMKSVVEEFTISDFYYINYIFKFKKYFKKTNEAYLLDTFFGKTDNEVKICIKKLIESYSKHRDKNKWWLNNFNIKRNTEYEILSKLENRIIDRLVNKFDILNIEKYDELRISLKKIIRDIWDSIYEKGCFYVHSNMISGYEDYKIGLEDTYESKLKLNNDILEIITLLLILCEATKIKSEDMIAILEIQAFECIKEIDELKKSEKICKFL